LEKYTFNRTYFLFYEFRNGDGLPSGVKCHDLEMHLNGVKIFVDKTI